MCLMNGTTNIRNDPKNAVRIKIKFNKYNERKFVFELSSVIYTITWKNRINKRIKATVDKKTDQNDKFPPKESNRLL